MKKVVELIGVADMLLVDNLIYLDRIVKLYAKFMQDYRYAETRMDGDKVIIRFSKINMYGYMNWTEREFDASEIVDKIIKYKAKVKYEFKNRHNNVRLLREREINKWKRVIEYAKIQMSE